MNEIAFYMFVSGSKKNTDPLESYLGILLNSNRLSGKTPNRCPSCGNASSDAGSSGRAHLSGAGGPFGTTNSVQVNSSSHPFGG